MSQPIEPKNDAWMVEYANRVPKYIAPDFTKTKAEREALSLVKNSYSPKSNSFKPHRGIKHRLIVHVKYSSGDRTNYKTTYSTIIKEVDINTFLSSNDIEINNIIAMYFNNKPYSL